jgi:hypothetical protein
MTSYTEAKSKRIIDKILEVAKRSDTDIDGTINIRDTDMEDVLNELRISNFDFNFVKALKRTLSFYSYLIVYKENKILKLKKDYRLFNDTDY